jgi:AraC-like DNA-binding protein
VFGCAVSSLEIEPASWRLGLRRADPTLKELLRSLASGLELGDVGSDLEAVLRARFRILLPDGCPSAAAVARSVGLTERTLQRQLKQAGTSFTRVLDNFREAEAELLLASDIPLTEVALRLGFSDQTTWNRAFRRWKGTSPRQWVLAQPADALRRPSVSRT